jgi:hypothetical protein
MEELINESLNRCSRCVSGRHVLSIHDTSEINYQSHAGRLDQDDPDLGPVGNDHDIGFFLHPGLVVDAEDTFPLGFSAIHLWNRDFNKLNKHERNYAQQPIEEKESYRWISVSQQMKSSLKDAKMLTIVADRESDIYEEFVDIPDEKTHLLIRSKSNRLLYDQDMKLFDHLSSQKLGGSYDLKIKGDKRSKRKGRTALIEVRYSKVKISRPQKVSKDYPDYIELYAVEARENASTVPKGEKPILWRLLTSHVVESYEWACKIISWYCLRWLIEQLFRTLKSKGVDIEASQLEQGIALKRLLIIALQAALRIMQLVQEREGKSGIQADVVFDEKEIEFLRVIGPHQEGKTKKQQNPYNQDSLAWAAWIIARLGGWKGHKPKSPPGPISMSRGLKAFGLMFFGAKMNRSSG